jgi:hypothetical protein
VKSMAISTRQYGPAGGFFTMGAEHDEVGL